MISTKTIIDKTNTFISGASITDLQFTQLSSVQNFLDNSNNSVASVLNLPSAADYEGVTYYVSSEGQYYFSDGEVWRKEFASNYLTAGLVYAWGSNGSGRLGDNTTSNRGSPVSIVGGVTNWSEISAGDTHSFAITNSGIAYCWGTNNYGQLGTNNTSSRSSPVQLSVGIKWSQISAQINFTAGISSSGIAYAWGKNQYGQLGNNTTSSFSSPVTVVGGITNWNRVAAGGNHTLGLTSGGILYSWGWNGNFALGDGTGTNRSSPTIVAGGITTWAEIAAGESHSLGITLTGVAYAWGNNGNGQLGDNSVTNRSSPVTVVGGITNWSKIAGGQGHTIALTTGFVLYGWGRNDQGQLGNNTVTYRSSPVTVVGGITNWSQISAGRQHCLGLTSSGILYSWGSNSNAQLGVPVLASASSPVSVQGANIQTWSKISAGGYHNLSLYAYDRGFII